jgi:ribosomal protein S18 acetylase RimI-like enzyme
MPILYRSSLSGLSPRNLQGFFVGWKRRPSPRTLLRLLHHSNEIIVAYDSAADRVAGFVTAITDHVLSAYIPLLEVLPKYRKQGIGRELVRRMLRKLEPYYMVDVVCDESVVQFYKKFRLTKSTAMIKRNYKHQSGRGTGRG